MVEDSSDEGTRAARLDSKGWFVASGTVFAGACFIAVGWLMEDKGYPSSLLQNMGVALLLLAPLFAIERTFRGQVRQVAQESKVARRDVASVEARIASPGLGELGDEMAQELANATEGDRRLAEDARAAVSVETLGLMFDRACELKAISEHGLRVAVPHRFERFRFIWPAMPGDHDGVEDGAIRILVEDLAGKPIDVAVNWKKGEPVANALASLAALWKNTGTYPGDSAIAADVVIGDLISSLDLAIQSRSEGGEDPLSPLIERLSQEWVMTDFGLEHLPYPYWIRASELRDENELEDWRRHMQSKVWVQEEDDRAKASGEPDFWSITKAAHYFFLAHPG